MPPFRTMTGGASSGVTTMPKRPTNRDLLDQFRHLLTDGVDCGGLDRAAFLANTKPWRADLWALMLEIEDRLSHPQEIEAARLERAKNGRP